MICVRSRIFRSVNSDKFLICEGVNSLEKNRASAPTCIEFIRTSASRPLPMTKRGSGFFRRCRIWPQGMKPASRVRRDNSSNSVSGERFEFCPVSRCTNMARSPSSSSMDVFCSRANSLSRELMRVSMSIRVDSRFGNDWISHGARFFAEVKWPLACPLSSGGRGVMWANWKRPVFPSSTTSMTPMASRRRRAMSVRSSWDNGEAFKWVCTHRRPLSLAVPARARPSSGISIPRASPMIT